MNDLSGMVCFHEGTDHEVFVEKGKSQGLIIRAKQQGNLLKCVVDQRLSNIANHATGGGVRSAITGFSRASRKRLLEKFAALDEKAIKESGVAFLTLTYGQSWPTPAEAKTHLESYVRRIGRRTECLDPSFIWKMEPQERGAPHFHIAIFGWKKIKNGWPLTKHDFARMWGEVIGVEYMDYTLVNESGDIADLRAPFTRIELVRSFKRLMYYVSKYMAKEFEQKESTDQAATSPASGLDSASALSSCTDSDPALATPPRGAGGGCETGFINLAYLATDGEPIEFIGRSWGIMYRDNLPSGEVQEILLTCNGNFEDFHRHVRWKWARISKDQRGFTVFHEKAADWFGILERYMSFCEGVPF